MCLLLGCVRLNAEQTTTNAEAFEVIKAKAEKGDATAQFNLGLLYDNGQGVTQDYAEALKWYRKAADQGNAKAQFNLGFLYDNGQGVTQSELEAYIWFSLAAAQGSKGAPHNRDFVASKLSRPELIEGQRRAAAFVPHKETAASSSPIPAISAPTPPPESPSFTGTGFFITDDGYLISNHHVVKAGTKFRIKTASGIINVQVVKVDAANDLALLKATGSFSPLPVAPSRGVKLGSTVATVGFPDTTLQGFSPKLSKGEIASLAGASDDPRYFQISVPVQHGNSGGALLRLA